MPLIYYYNPVRSNIYLPLLGILFVLTISSCRDDNGVCISDPECLRLRFRYYQSMGDSLSKLKSSTTAIIDSKVYYDSAALIAHGLADSSLLATNYLSLGRMYYDWGTQPDMAIEYIEEAGKLFEEDKDYENHYYESKLLLCKSLLERSESSKVLTILEQLLEKISNSSLDMTTLSGIYLDLGMVALMSHNTTLVKKALQSIEILKLKQPDLIIPDPMKYYLLHSEAVFFSRDENLQPLDSLDKLYSTLDILQDSLFYAGRLTTLMERSGRFEKAFHYQTILTDLLLHENARYGKLAKQKIEFAEQSLEHTRNIEKKTDQLWVIIICWLVLFAIASSYIILFLRRGSTKYYKLSKDLEFANNNAAILYKELHHRIKNNLHLIFSLLQMQERKTDDKVTKLNLRDARLRIESIAIMHEEMMNLDGKIDFKDFIFRLIQLIINCFSLSTHIISEINFEKVEIPHKYNFPIALIINEWISNSIKHAILGDKYLEITLNVFQENDQVVIEYYDNGDQKAETEPSSGLGTNIVQLLMKQIKAELFKGHRGLYHYKIKMGRI